MEATATFSQKHTNYIQFYVDTASLFTLFFMYFAPIYILFISFSSYTIIMIIFTVMFYPNTFDRDMLYKGHCTDSVSTQAQIPCLVSSYSSSQGFFTTSLLKLQFHFPNQLIKGTKKIVLNLFNIFNECPRLSRFPSLTFRSQNIDHTMARLCFRAIIISASKK